MKNTFKLMAGILAIGLASSGNAAVQILETLMLFKVNGVDTYRQGDRADSGTFYNPRLSVDGFGATSFDLGAGNSLLLDRVFLKTNHWNGGTTPDGGGSNDNWIPTSHQIGLNYSITPTGGADSWQYIQAANTVSGNVQEWNIGSLNRNLLSGLSAGTYSFKYYFDVTYNSWTGTETVLGHTYDAVGVQAGAGNGPNLANASSTTFTVVPEPSTGMLMGLGVAGLLVVRRIRKSA
jgi:hypothetical protein